MARRDPNLDQPVNRTTVILLGAFIVLALVLRIAFNIGVAYDAEGDRYLYSGNDPWYHDRTVDHILETGESLQFDPAINYPNGGVNPNPPLYDWVAALDAWFLDSAGVSDASGLALNLNVAVWGALIVIPAFMIGNMLWGRRAGLWGGFFMAVSAPHIQRSVFGFADHDAPTMFFITLLVAALLKAMAALKNKEYVSSWKGNPLPGVKSAFKDNQVAMAWTAIAGTALAATALTWKGYPYILAVMAVAFGFQLLVDHTKNRDSTAISLVYLLPVVLGLLVALPFYNVLGLGGSTITPHLYVLIGMLVAAAILVPTRELPSILVFPALFVAAALGLVFMLVVVPAAGALIFSGLGYFNQSKLYSTIAEAQRTELGFVAANFGFFAFLLAFWPYFSSARGGFKGHKGKMLMFAWATIAFFMAFSAGRFVFNAAPVFAVLAGAGTAWVLNAAGIDEMGKRIRNLARQGSPVGAFFKGLTPKTTTAVILVAAVLVLPNVWLGVDAAMSREYELDNGLADNDPDTHEFFGAFGVGFDIKENGWLALFDELASRDTELDFEDRPAFMAWWDYGHWATSIGKHPTVADPFQNHFEQSGRFLSAESEEEGMLWMTLLLWNANRDNADAQNVWTQHGIAPGTVVGDLDAQYDAIDGLATASAYDVYEEMMDATGQRIEYFGVDERMFPINVQNSGIFYAPAFLANKNPDDFVRFTYSDGQSLLLDFQQYDVDANGDSFRLAEPRFVDTAGDEWVVFGNQAYRDGQQPANFGGNGAQTQGIAVSPNLQLTDAFANSMFAKAFGHISAAQGAPGDGLTHWRALHESLRAGGQVRSTALLQYYSGHEVSGVIQDANGQPMSGVDVTFVDGFGAAHAVGSTNAQGQYTVLAPFGDDLSLTVRDGGANIYSVAWPALEDGGSTTGADVSVPFASMTGRAFNDANGNSAYDAGEEVSGVSVTVNGKSANTAADGTYTISNIVGGQHTVTVAASGYNVPTPTVSLIGGESTTQDIILGATPSEVSLFFKDAGEGVSGVPIRIAGATTSTVTTSADGLAVTTLAPGTYTVSVDFAFTENGEEVVYDEERTLVVPFGGADQTLTIDA